MHSRAPKCDEDMPRVRVLGKRWCVSISDADWIRFAKVICRKARNRLLVILDHFTDFGEANLPKGSFRWLSQPKSATGAARHGAFEAHGVVMRGRAAKVGAQQMFFVTEIEEDPPTSKSQPTNKRTNKQGKLPLTFSLPKGVDHG